MSPVNPRWISRMVWWLWGAFPWVFTTPRATWPPDTWRWIRWYPGKMEDEVLENFVSFAYLKRVDCIWIETDDETFIHSVFRYCLHRILWWELIDQTCLPFQYIFGGFLGVYFENHELWHPWTQINPCGLSGSGPCPGSSHRVRREAASRDCGRVMQGAPWNSPNLKFPCLPAARVRPVLEIHAPLLLGDQLGRFKNL